MNHTGSHKINNTLGQCLLARRMGKKKVIAETGAGQHGVATATAAALFGMECRIFMGEEDIRRQAHNVHRMRILGADVVPIAAGTATLKDAMNEAMRYWVSAVRDTFYVIGTVAGPHPYPVMVRDFQSVIGREAKRQILKKEGRLPDSLIACVGGGSNALGLFYPFIGDAAVAMTGVEAAGKGLSTGLHAASITAGRVGVLHGNKTYLLQNEQGQVRDAYAIAAGLDYPGVGPEHAWLHETGRARYVSVTDDEAVEAFVALSRSEGIIPALESAHAVAHAIKAVPAMAKGQHRHHQPLRPGRQGRGDHRREEGGKRIMGRIEARFAALKKGGRKAFVAYLTAGDPDLETTAGLIPALEAAGVDIIEIGVPFSDPTADGPVIQAASQRALKGGATLAKILAMIAALRRTSEIPIVLFGYYNPILSYGPDRFAADAAASGVDGILVVDLPPEEAGELRRYTDKAGLAFITLVAPTTDSARVKKILRGATGFVYYISVTGVTGTAAALPDDVRRDVERIQRADAPSRRRRLRDLNPRTGGGDRAFGRRRRHRERPGPPDRREGRRRRPHPGGLRLCEQRSAGRSTPHRMPLFPRVESWPEHVRGRELHSLLPAAIVFFTAVKNSPQA